MSKKIKKAGSVSSEAAAAIERAIAVVAPFAANGQVAGWIAKGRALAEGGKVSSLPLDATVSKVERKFDNDLTAATIAVQKMDSDDPGRPAARKRLAKLQAVHQGRNSPGYARVEEMRKVDRGEAPFVGRQTPEVGDDATIKRAAELLRKSDPSLSPYEALERAYKAERAA